MPSSPAAPSLSPTGIPAWKGPKPKVTGSQIIMIDPDGKKYTRKTMIQMAAGMAAVSAKLPENFCTQSYEQGVKEGGKFPAGKLAFLEACREGVRLAGG